MTTSVMEPKDRAKTAHVFLNDDTSAFRENFNRNSFLVRHTLAQHPLFQIPRLIKLAKSVADGGTREVYFDSGKAGVNQRWDQMPIGGHNTEVNAKSVEDVLERIATANLWMDIRHAERDPEYNELLQTGLAQIEEMAGVSLKNTIKRHLLIFITSPGRITPYHIDKECNFLLQVNGTKEVHLFDKADREVLPEEEIERQWAVDPNAAQYREQYENRARVFKLVPGTGVHHPVNAPHWVKNGDEISVSAAFVFQFPSEELGDIYRMNYYLRKIGIRPSPPRSAQLVVPDPRNDRMKSVGYKAVRALLDLKNSVRK